MIKLTRFAETTTPGGTLAETLGRLSVVQQGRELWSCKAIELPGRDNQNNVSRIPAGTYVAEVVDSSPSFDYQHVWIHDENSVYAAETRSGVKIHIANYARQLRGCIAPGEEFVDLDRDGQLDVASSEAALKGLLARMEAHTELVIENDDSPDEAETAPLAELSTTTNPVREYA